MAQTVHTHAHDEAPGPIPVPPPGEQRRAARPERNETAGPAFQAIGLTRSQRRGRPPTLLDLSFDARAGQVTVLLGPEGSGRSTALRLALGLERGQGAALFHGVPYAKLRRPEREVGVVLGEAGRPAGHPGRRARAHLRMLAAAAGMPARRADQLLEQTRLGPAAEHRLRTFSPGMTRRLQLAQALLGDPRTLLLDEPTEGLSPKNIEWFHAFLRAFAAGGGAVLVTLRSPQEAARLGDRVVTLDLGRLLADQSAEEFRRTRLRDEVSVRGPQVARLADVLTATGAAVRRTGGNSISVEGATRTEIGELAFRHGILLHELADHTVEHPPAEIPAVGRKPAETPVTGRSSAETHAGTPAETPAAGPPPIRRGPASPRVGATHLGDPAEQRGDAASAPASGDGVPDALRAAAASTAPTGAAAPTIPAPATGSAGAEGAEQTPAAAPAAAPAATPAGATAAGATATAAEEPGHSPLPGRPVSAHAASAGFEEAAAPAWQQSGDEPGAAWTTVALGAGETVTVTAVVAAEPATPAEAHGHVVLEPTAVLLGDSRAGGPYYPHAQAHPAPHENS